MNGGLKVHKSNGQAKEPTPRASTEHLTDLNSLMKGKIVDGWEVGTDPKVDRSGHKEFGGALGVSAMMIGFPALMYYMWLGATYYDGHLPLPAQGQSTSQFIQELGRQIYTGAFPSLKAWSMYWGMFVFEMCLYVYAPGIWTKGKQLSHLNNQKLDYYCSGIWSFWITNAVAAALHFSGVMPLYTISDEFGPIMSVAIISGFLVSIVAYASALARGAQHRMTGNTIYDFFMGAELNPRLRLPGSNAPLDFKMFFEVRLPWYILLLTTAGMCARQYERYSYVSAEAALLLLAHYLYANACSKGEECITTTWDMYFEKWGFMLIFWNMAGVPLSYCHATIYLANRNHRETSHSPWLMYTWFAAYLFVYWVWDTTNSQKNRFRIERAGGAFDRWTFPPLLWASVKNPRVIESENGPIFVDGMYKYARKIHYTCDLFFALSWAGVTGFNSPFPWFYPLFFSCMIVHRAIRDIQRCRAKYGEAWMQYEKEVPYLFIPYIFYK
ncbi:C-24(28) sterol reductase [Elasticomyces elasticus]|nr:C-24(28) sterol reductase [Elasticomyces elasticus]